MKVVSYLCLISACALTNLAHGMTEKPNTLMIVGDDIGFGDLGISGSVTRTPDLNAWEPVSLTSLKVRFRMKT